MSDFNWDDHPVVSGNQKKEQSGFNWDDHPVLAPQEHGILPTIVDKIAQGGSAGLADEASGAVEALGQAAGVEGLGGKIKDIKWSDHGPTLDWEVLRHAYKNARDKDREVLKQEGEQHPVVSGASELAGAVMSPLNKLIPTGSSGAQAGAIIGGAQGFGNSDAEDLSGIAKDTATGAGLGLGAGIFADKVIQPAINKVTPYLSEKLGGLAERQGARALGATKASLKREGSDEILKTARGALDNDIISPLASTEKMMERAQSLKAKGGSQMGDVYQAVDDAGASTFNPQQVRDEVNDKIGGFYKSPINRGETNQLQNTLESISMRGKENIPLSEAQVLKEELGRVANWKNKLNITEKEKMARDAYGIVNNAIDSAAASGSEQVGIDGLKESLQQGKNLYKVGKGAEKLLDDKTSAELGNKMMGLTDTITGVGGYAAMGPKGLLFLAGKKLLEKYGNQVTAVSADSISKALQKSPQMLQFAQKNPAAFQEMVQKLEKQSGGMINESFPRAADKQDGAMNSEHMLDKDSLLQKAQGSRYGQILQNAANQSDDSLSAAHYVLAQQDPQYRKTMGFEWE